MFHAQCLTRYCSDGNGCNNDQWCGQGHCCPSGQEWVTCPEGAISCTPKCCPAETPYLDKEGNCSECMFHAQCSSQLCGDYSGCNSDQWCRRGQCCGVRVETIQWSGRLETLYTPVQHVKTIGPYPCHYQVIFTALAADDSFAVTPTGGTTCKEKEQKFQFGTMSVYVGATNKPSKPNQNGRAHRINGATTSGFAKNSDGTVDYSLIDIGNNDKWDGQPVSNDETRTIYYLPAGQTLEFYVINNYDNNQGVGVNATLTMTLKLKPKESITGGCGHWVQ